MRVMDNTTRKALKTNRDDFGVDFDLDRIQDP